MEKVKKSTAQIEAEKMSRRQVLGRVGFLAGAAAVAALTTDDLARLVGREMQKRAGDNKVINQVAKEFQNAGIAIAQGPPPPFGECVAPPWTEDDDCTFSGVLHYCDYHFSCGNPSTAVGRCEHCCEAVFSSVGACHGQAQVNDVNNCQNRCRGEL